MLTSSFSFENIVQLLHTSNNYYLVKVDAHGDYAYMNSHFKDNHSAYYGDDTVKSAAAALHPDDYEISYATYLQCIKYPDQSFTVNLRKLDGKDGYIITYWEYKANRLSNGEIDGVVGVGYDITAFESRKEHIRYLTSTLNQVAFQQSHLVRRPLANVMGLVEVLQELSQKDELMNDIVGMLKQSCKELNDEFELFMIRELPDDGGNTNT